MNCATGDVVNMTDNLRKELLESGEYRKYAPLKKEDVPKVVRMNKDRRKNWMRNKPCPCNSGKKFKKCCWNQYVK
jgi:uncharacterized protein YecA (UPF0149 family)